MVAKSALPLGGAKERKMASYVKTVYTKCRNSTSWYIPIASDGVINDKVITRLVALAVHVTRAIWQVRGRTTWYKYDHTPHRLRHKS